MTRYLAPALSFAAVLYGGVLLGLGNWLSGPDPDHEHHHESLVNVAALPAHCVFCIDGISPAQTTVPELPRAPDFGRVCVSVVPPADVRIGANAQFLARGPPSSIAPVTAIRAIQRWRTPWTARPPDLRSA